jgi:apolipoprotein N-acyltransferase
MPLERHSQPLSARWAVLFAAAAVICFEIAYWPAAPSPCRFLIIGYLVSLVQLARLNSTRKSFYSAFGVGLVCTILQLDCFWRIFGVAAIPLWGILALWIAVFVGLVHVLLVRFGMLWTALCVPFVWTGTEYFRSELYYLKFSWLNIGYVFATGPHFPFHAIGMYGLGFVVALCAGLFLLSRRVYALAATAVLMAGLFLPVSKVPDQPAQLSIVGVQLEFPMEHRISAALDRTLARHPDAPLFVLSEYTLDGPVPESLKTWCRTNHRYLIVGGKDPAPGGNFYDTAFVVDPNGEIIFRQVKSVPIQFFKDGLPATKQELWNSPWGRIGICICYDLSYTRVTDRLVKLGAQALIVPTMDVVDWGRREHELHALVAPVRAAEYRIPIFRLASSGISQAVDANGRVVAEAPFPGEEAVLAAPMRFPDKGSLPIDRPLAIASVIITGLLIILGIFTKPLARPETIAAAPASAETPESKPQPDAIQERS